MFSSVTSSCNICLRCPKLYQHITFFFFVLQRHITSSYLFAVFLDVFFITHLKVSHTSSSSSSLIAYLYLKKTPTIFTYIFGMGQIYKLPNSWLIKSCISRVFCIIPKYWETFGLKIMMHNFYHLKYGFQNYSRNWGISDWQEYFLHKLM